MIITPTRLAGVFLIVPEMLADERGFFARTFCADAFAEHGLNPVVAQCSVSFNARRGTLRGLHYQTAPHEEARLVRCTRGSAFDVVVDLRRGSDAFGQWQAFELSAEDRSAVYVPEGCAHGFQTLEDDTEILYQMSEEYHADCSTGIRWDDPAIGIQWPAVEPRILSARDAALPLLGDEIANP